MNPHGKKNYPLLMNSCRVKTIGFCLKANLQACIASQFGGLICMKSLLLFHIYVFTDVCCFRVIKCGSSFLWSTVKHFVHFGECSIF